jgi:hypothetical protein
MPPPIERGGVAARPTVRLEHLQTLTDSTGVLRRSIGTVPDPHGGYTTDDNARALLAMVRLWRHAPERRDRVEPLLRRYLSFLLWTQVSHGERAGRFVNEVGYDRSFQDVCGTEDSLGRAVWALGVALDGPLPEGVRLVVDTLLTRALPQLPRLRSLRARAYALLGLCQGRAHEPDELRRLVDPIVEAYATHARSGWHWFEPYLLYDNARLVEAVLRVGFATGDSACLRIGSDTRRFLTDHSLTEGGMLRPVGTRGWWEREGTRAPFDQTAAEAASYVDLYRFVSDAPAEATARAWFLGHNVHGLPVADDATGGCFDALTANGLEPNQSAEATIAYLLCQL